MKLSPEEAAAEAVARWLGCTARPGRHCRRFNLPNLDFPRFFTSLASQLESDSSEFSFCAAGFDIDHSTLATEASKAGLKFKAVATHLQQAGKWRNIDQTTIIALARGEPEGGNTLAEFETASSSELATTLLRWLADPEHEFSDVRNDVPVLHGRLLKILSDQPPPGLVLSLDAVCRFAASWAAARDSKDASQRTNAPLAALAELNIGWDGDLFQTRGDSEERSRDTLRQNLISAIQTTVDILNLGDDEVRKLSDKAAKDTVNQPKFRALMSAIGEAHRKATPERLRAIRLDHFRLLSKKKRSGVKPPPRETLDWEDVESHVISNLLNKNTSACETLFEAIDSTDVVQGKRTLTANIDDLDQDLSLAALPPELEVLTTVVDIGRFGAVSHFSHDQPTMALLRQFSPAGNVTFFDEDIVILQDDQSGEVYDLRRLFATWDEFHLPELEEGPPLTELWEKWRSARSALLDSQEWLLLSPITALSGNPALRKQVEVLINAAADLFQRLAGARDAMVQAWRPGAEAVFEALLAIDVLQVRVANAKASQPASRLLLLTTHPVRLWRSYTFVAKCLLADENIDDQMREAIVRSLNRADLYLSAWFASRIPGNEGAHKSLPFAGVIAGVPVYQNLDNAVSTVDGAEDVTSILVKFASIYPEFCRPLRVTVVNPPDPERLLPALAKALDESKGPERLELRFAATSRLRSRLADAQKLYLAASGALGDAIDSGQLSLEIYNDLNRCNTLSELITALQDRPSHLLVVFDSSTVELQSRRQNYAYPMSPFTLTRELRRTGPPSAPRLELEARFTEPLFSGTQKLIVAAHGSQGDSLTASISACDYSDAINNTLQHAAPAAIWVIVVDRSLPSSALTRLRPLLQKSGQTREVGVYCRDLLWLATRVRSAFKECNIELRDTDLDRLLLDGTALLSGGLLELIQSRDGKPNSSLVQGLTGTLFVARKWKAAHPSGLLLSVDSEAARLWLGLGSSSVRSDLLGIWEKDGHLQVDVIEVKTSQSPIESDKKDEAAKQVISTLTATEHALEGADALSVPRREMLKEVLKQAVDVAPFEHQETNRRKHQAGWIEWLLRLFHAPEAREKATINGFVYCVHLRDKNPPAPHAINSSGRTIQVIYLGEEECMALGLAQPGQPTATTQGGDNGVGASETLISARLPVEDPNRALASEAAALTSVPGAKPTPEVANITSQQSPAVTSPDKDGQQEIGSLQTATNVRPLVTLGVKNPGEGDVVWEPFRSQQPSYNPHTIVLGGSGSGKTETIKAFLSELNAAGVGCVVFDFKDDYVGSDIVAGLGANIHLAEDGLPINPMLPGIDPLTGRVDVKSHVFNIEGTLTKVYGLGPQQGAVLRAALLCLYDRCGFPNTPTVLDPTLRIPSFEELRTELQRDDLRSDTADTLVSRLSPIFDLNLFSSERGHVDSLFSGVNIIRFTRLPNEEVKKACAEIVLLGIYNEILRLGHAPSLRCLVVVDEAHRIAELDAVKLLLREARAYGVGVLLSSQQAKDFADDIYANADTIVGLKLNHPKDAERLGAILGGTQNAKELADKIRKLHPGEAFLKNSQYAPYVRLKVTRIADR